jgi:ribosomal protein S15P/S13E
MWHDHSKAQPQLQHHHRELLNIVRKRRRILYVVLGLGTEVQPS